MCTIDTFRFGNGSFRFGEGQPVTYDEDGRTGDIYKCIKGNQWEFENMKIVEIRDSMEQCNEAGWQAFDFFVENPLTDEDILKLKPMGNFLYLSMLKAPFFKVDGNYVHIKGVKGNAHFRVAVHGEYIRYIDEIKTLAES